MPATTSSTAIFANNLTNDSKYAQSDDGKTIACNYLSPEDMIAYCCWAGLRSEEHTLGGFASDE